MILAGEMTAMKIKTNRNKLSFKFNVAKPKGPDVALKTPRIAHLMAAAIRFEELVQSGQVSGYAEIARLSMVSRARLTQVMNLRLLAPEIQEYLLFLPPSPSGKSQIKERQLRPLMAVADWQVQRDMWQSLISKSAS
jgi:hypothetical protein